LFSAAIRGLIKVFIEATMPDENLLKYIKEGLAQGRTEEILRPLLLSAGWAQKDIDDAFAFTNGAPTPTIASGSVTSASNIAQAVPAISQPQPQSQSQQPLPRSTSNKKLWIAAGVLVLAVVVAGGWAAYAYFLNPSPQQVLDEMFQNGFSGITSMDNDTMVSLNIQVTAASTTPVSGVASGSGINPYASMLLGGGNANFTIQAESSGTFVVVPDGNRNVDQNMKFGFNTSESGQSVTLSGSGELRVVDGAAYVNISSIPGFGFFNPTSLEGKWIELKADSSTESMAQSITGQPSLTIPSTTLSADDIQKISSAMEQAITITKTLPDETLGGVSNYHYQYAINKPGLQNAMVIAATTAAHAFGQASSTLDASTTAAINASTADFLGAFTTMGGELWIGKSDHYPHQISLALAFSTTTPYGVVNGTVNVTSTHANINGGQTINIPSGAEDITTFLQSALSSSTLR
jgi:hypothetical protein